MSVSKSIIQANSLLLVVVAIFIFCSYVNDYDMEKLLLLKNDNIVNQNIQQNNSILVYDLLSLDINKLNINYSQYKKIYRKQHNIKSCDIDNYHRQIVINSMFGDKAAGLGNHIMTLAELIKYAYSQNKAFLYSTTDWVYTPAKYKYHANKRKYYGISYYFEPLTNCHNINKIKNNKNIK